MMTRAEHRERLVTILSQLEDSGDPEGAHSVADHEVMAYLTAIGDSVVVEAFNAIPKWYA